MDEFGTLWVEASEQDGIITIRIRDDGKGFEISEKMEQNAKDERKGIGLRYVQMTLKSFYGEEAEMKIESELGKGTEVTLHFRCFRHKKRTTRRKREKIKWGGTNVSGIGD